MVLYKGYGVIKKGGISLVTSILKRMDKHFHFICTVPALVLFSIFYMYPMFSGMYYSLTDWDGIRKSFNFIGLQNFSTIFKDARIHDSILFTVEYVVELLLLTMIISMVLALILNSRIKMRDAVRTVFFFPAVLSLVTIGLVFNELFREVLPAVGKLLGIGFLSSNILANIETAKYGILIVSLWQWCALPTVLILAGLQSIPESLIEAAEIDGASQIQIFKSIMFPYLIPVLNVVFVLTLKNGLTVFDYIFAMTQGGPARSTESIGYQVYTFAFLDHKFGYSIALATVLFVVIAGISLLQMKALKRFEVEQ